MASLPQASLPKQATNENRARGTWQVENWDNANFYVDRNNWEYKNYGTQSESPMSPYLKSDHVISDMAVALSWLRDLSDIRLVRRELSCAGFNEDDIDHYADCAVVYARARRELFAGPNQMTTDLEKPDEDK